MVKKRWKSFLVKKFLEREGCNDPEVAIIKSAEHLVKNANYIKPPVDVFKLARIQGIRIEKIERMSCDGRLIPTADSSFIIEISQNTTFERMRFTVAHELAHQLLLGEKFFSLSTKEKAEILNILNPDREVEYLCNLGASEILMPTYLFEPRLRQYGISINALYSLSRDFQTSIKSTAIRIVRADEHCIFILWKLMSKPGATEELRIDWSATPRGIFLPRYARPNSPRRPVLHTVCKAFEAGKSCGLENIKWLGNLRGDYYVESIKLNSSIPSVLSLIHLA